MSLIKKVITKSNSRKIKTKTKQFDLYFIGKEMGLVPNATGQEVDKKQEICAKLKNTLPFLKTINFKVNVIRYQLKSLICSFISLCEAINTFFIQ